MTRNRIRFFDRYQQKYCFEKVYGETALRFAYETMVGRALGILVFARPFFSKWFGWRMNRPGSRTMIGPFVRDYGLDPSEFKLPLDQFRSFNEFFHRELKDGARPVDSNAGSIVFPADGRHMGWQETGPQQGVFLKGQEWNLAELLDNDPDLVRRFDGGTLVMSRLCPVDYHHFHYPADGVFRESRWTGKWLFSVNPIALGKNLSYLWRNKRCLNLIDGGRAGLYCLIEVGATNVGTIRHRSLPPDRRVCRGDPKGWFEFGGSSVLTLFERGRVVLSQDLIRQTSQATELYARMGDQMGRIVND